MEFDVYERTYARLESVVDAIVETSFENWPKTAKDLAFAVPLLSIPLGPDALKGVLSTNPSYQRLSGVSDASKRPAVDLGQAEDIETDVFPKIGPVSWKEVPVHTRLGPPRTDLQLENALGSITDRMSLILAPLAAQGVPTMLHVFPWHDISDMGEARMAVVEGAVIRGRWLRLPSGMRHTDTMRTACISVARETALEFQTGTLEIDVCVSCSQDSVVARLLEVNPLLDH